MRRTRNRRGRFVSGNDRYAGLPDPMAQNALAQVSTAVANAISSRQQMAEDLMDPRRNINHECGYPETDAITSANYKDLYEREPVATRVVQLEPFETWRLQPQVYENEETETVTAFEEAWDQLGKNLAGKGWYQREEGSPIWDFLRRVDELSGIGSYGVLLLGLDDGQELKEPVEGVEEGNVSKAQRKLLYLRAFDESQVNAVKLVTDSRNPRFGWPETYQFTFFDPLDIRTAAGGYSSKSKAVHWTRIIHVADNLVSSEVFGVPRMRPVLNPLLDIRKVRGGSAEMYWLGAFFGLSFETHPALGGDVAVDLDDLRDMYEEYKNGLQRALFTSGMMAKPLSPTVVDPKVQIDVQVEAICIQKACPKRIFTGSERGELASSQDERAWELRLQGRRQNHVTPRIIVPFVDRLILCGVLPEPQEYFVKWAETEALDEVGKAQVAVLKTDVMVKYAAGGIEETLMLPLDFLTEIVGIDEEKAKAMLKAIADRIAEGETGGSPLLSFVGGLTGITEVFKAAKEGAFTTEQVKQILMLFFKLSPEKVDELVAEASIEEQKAEDEAKAAAELEKLKAQQPPEQPVPGQPPRQRPSPENDFTKR